jgi:formylglycine-generating enzyme required for sulfatase activity
MSALLSFLLVAAAHAADPPDWLPVVSVPAGSFTQGCDPARDPLCRPDELPARSVTLSGYRIGRTEVTRGMWARCVDARACRPPIGAAPVGATDDWPVTLVGKDDAAGFCAWAGGRLPTEAEWEKAARGATDARPYPWGDAAASCDRARLVSCPVALGPVGAFPAGASPVGALDMVGSVAEWTADGYRADAYRTLPDDNPSATVGGTTAVVRGAGFASPGSARVTARTVIPFQAAGATLGLRCAWDGE